MLLYFFETPKKYTYASSILFKCYYTFLEHEKSVYLKNKHDTVYFKHRFKKYSISINEKKYRLSILEKEGMQKVQIKYSFLILLYIFGKKYTYQAQLL